MQKTRKDKIAEVLSEYKSGLHVEQIAKKLLRKELEKNISIEKLSKTVSGSLSQDIRKHKRKSQFSIVKNKKGGHKKGWYKLKAKRKTVEQQGISEIEKGAEIEKSDISPNYTGKAGEYAVLSELLFRGFNAALMTVDEGIDIVAFKESNYFHIQVKTSKKRGYFYTSIAQKQFDKFNDFKTFYIFVLRYLYRGKERNGFIIMRSPELQVLRHKGVINSGVNLTINITIQDGKIILNNSENISCYFNKFEYIV